MKHFIHFFLQHTFLGIVLLGFFVSTPLLFPYLHSGYFPTHDGEWAVVRLTDMYRELKDFQFPARYSGNLNFGYGYPLFEFAYPLPYYLGFLIHVFHISFINSIKLLFALSVPASFFAMFLLVKKLWKTTSAGVLAGVLYIYFPYRLVDLFVRGSLGESLSFVLFPLIMYCMLQLHQTKKMIFAVYAGIGFAALIVTHNIMVVEFAPIMCVFAAASVYTEKKDRSFLLKNYFFTFFLGIGLACFFWLPALSEEHLIALSVIPIADRTLYFVQPLKFILPSWEYGTRDFSYQLGIVQLFVLILVITYLFIEKKKKILTPFHFILTIACIGVIGIYMFLLFSPSNTLWNIVPLFKEINYPWTLLALIGFLIALISGVLVRSQKSRKLLGILSIFAILYCLQYAHPSAYIDRGDDYYLTNDATTTSSDEYMPVWVQQKPRERTAKKFLLLAGKGSMSNEISTSKMFSADVVVLTLSRMQINTIYYPGWHVLVDGREADINYHNSKGLITFSLPAGTHHIDGILQETPLRLFADTISIIAFVIICGFFVLYWKGRYAKK